MSHYNVCKEVDGTFPEGPLPCAGSDRQCELPDGEPGAQNADIWRLGPDGTGKDSARLSNFNDFEGGRHPKR